MCDIVTDVTAFGVPPIIQFACEILVYNIHAGLLCAHWQDIVFIIELSIIQFNIYLNLIIKHPVIK